MSANGTMAYFEDFYSQRKQEGRFRSMEDSVPQEELSKSEAMQSSEEQSSSATVTAVKDQLDGKNALTLSPETIEFSSAFIGEWNELVSTTNWDKGRVITAWRDLLEKENAPITERSDEAWAQLVGFVTSQHVGRLRRVYQRFGSLREEYKGLYWSHFQAALDWEDAEMWLEGAIHNRWSVAKMRAARWEAVGAPDGVKPDEEEILEGEIEGEAYDALVESSGTVEPSSEYDPAESENSSSQSDEQDSAESNSSAAYEEEPVAVEAAARIRPFEDLAELPDDVTDAFEQFKLVILSHKLTGWEQISRDDMVSAIESLKTLVMAPSEENATAS